jgi:hypothetical protein
VSADTAEDALGPIDFLLLELDPDHMDGTVAAALLDLVDRGVVTILDLLVIRKEADGTVVGIDIDALSADALGGFTVFAGATSGLLSEDDVAEAAAAVQPARAAALLVYENTWARGFVTAALAAGAQVVASTRIPATDVNEVLDALDQADPQTA